MPTHADDLIALLDALKPGPVDLVAWSYAGHIAFDAALRRPDLFRSLFVYEPGVPSYVKDPAEAQAFAADAADAFGPVFEAVMRGDAGEAMKRMLDASGQRPGCFEDQDAAMQRIQQENARTMPLLLLGQQQPPAIRAEQLAQLPGLGVRVCVGYGARSRPLYAIAARAAQRCIAGTHLVVEQANHMWPDSHPQQFVEAVERFVGQARAA